MWKDRVRVVRDYIIRHSKVAFPIIVIAAVAVTVAVALNAGNGKAGMEETQSPEQTAATGESQEASLQRVVSDAPLEKNEDGAMYSLMATYYNALATGDVDTIRTISNYVEDTEEIRIQELSKYIESYPTIEIYTKPGPEENSYIAYVYSKVTFYGYEDQIPGLQTFYVCTDENGNLYFNEGETAEDILDYIKTVNLQDDVVELYNRVTVEYNDLMLENSKLFNYISELEQEVSKATGEALAAQIAESGSGEEGAQPSDTVPGTDQTGEAQAPAETTPSEEQPPAEDTPVYAVATTNVNVRSSDSEQAEKLGKLVGSTQVQVLEQRPNGWSKILFDGQEGYVKSEYLYIDGSSTGTATGAGGDSLGTVTATTNINLRSGASETAEKIGVVVGGDSMELLSKDNGWCQVRYNGVVGFVKEDYVQ